MQVDKILGPGNQYVTAAKMLLQNSEAMIAMDMPAGPSEVLVIADSEARPAFIAADLLSQAEHGPDSQVRSARGTLQTRSTLTFWRSILLSTFCRQSHLELGVAPTSTASVLLMFDVAQSALPMHCSCPSHQGAPCTI